MAIPVVRAQLEIALRNGATFLVGFPDTEGVNAFIERLKKATADTSGIFTFEMQGEGNSSCTHYIPAREIVRFTIKQMPKLTTPAPR